MVYAAIQQRIKKLQESLKKSSLDCFVIDSPVDLLYLTGLSFSLGRLLVSQDEAELFVDGRYIEFAKKNASCKVSLLDTFPKKLPLHAHVGFDSAYTTYEAFEAFQTTLPGRKWTPISQILKPLRMIKSPSEIEALKKAQTLTKEGLSHLMTLLKEGVSERELSWEFESFVRKRGASRLSFPPIVAFGENSAYPHHRAGSAKLAKNQIVLFDLGAVVDEYAGDLTRVTFFGLADPQLERDYELIQRAQKKAIALAAPHVRFGDLMDTVLQELKKEGCEALFTHGLSHGIGLEVHESPRLKIQGGGEAELRLEEGMAFTVEPGIYRPGLGGVRYEDVVVVTKNGHETL